MNIKLINHTTYAEYIKVDNCTSGRCLPQNAIRRQTIIREKIDVQVDAGSGILVNIQLSDDEIVYFKEIVFAKAKEKLASLNVRIA